jgi:hypothetical protein
MILISANNIIERALGSITARLYGESSTVRSVHHPFRSQEARRLGASVFEHREEKERVATEY